MSKRPHPSSRDSRRGSSSSDSHAGSETSSHSRRQNNPNSQHRSREERVRLPPLTETIPEFRTHRPPVKETRSRSKKESSTTAQDSAKSKSSRNDTSRPSRKHQKSDSDSSRSATLAIHSGPPSRSNGSMNSSPATLSGSNGPLTPATSIAGCHSVNGRMEASSGGVPRTPEPPKLYADTDRHRQAGWQTNEQLPSLPSMFGHRQPPPPPSPYANESQREDAPQYPSPSKDRYGNPVYTTAPPPYRIQTSHPHHAPPPPAPAPPHPHLVQTQRDPREPLYPLPPMHPQYPPHSAYGIPHDPSMNGHVVYAHPTGQMVSYSMQFENVDMTDPSGRRRRGNLPKVATNLFRDWLSKHISNPYPTEEEKQWMQGQTGMTASQVSNWFINARRRILPQMSRSAQAEHSFTSSTTGNSPHGGGGGGGSSQGSNGDGGAAIRDPDLVGAQVDIGISESTGNSPSMLLPPPGSHLRGRPPPQ